MREALTRPILQTAPRNLRVKYPHACITFPWNGSPFEFRFLNFDLGSIYALYCSMQGVDAAQEALPHHSWDQVFREALDYARIQVTPLHWRAARGGVLPHGYDPNSIAAQAILDILKTLPPQSREGERHREPHIPDMPSNPLLQTQTGCPNNLAEAIQRHVRQHINRLHHLKENFVTRNEPDLALVLTDDGEPVRLVDTLVAPDPTPLEHLIAHERDLERELFEARFNSFLGRERRLKKLFACYCAGLQKPLELARKLKTTVQTVYNLQKLLRRRLTRFWALPR